jgi:outer membrane protein OmpA-like peptidoglycan-associated protein
MKAIFTGFVLLFYITGYNQNSFIVRFGFSKYNLSETTRSALDSFLLAEKQNLPAFIVQLNGHCDAIGSDSYNNKLSKQRVAAVKKYLLSNGVESGNICDEIGHGKKQPLNENKTKEERQLNRRVEVSFSKIIVTYAPGVISLTDKLADSTTTAGTNIILHNINFFGGMHQFLPESEPMLEELLEAMLSNPKLVIRVEGHICCQEFNGDGMDGETGINNLSEARAKAVMDYLLTNGIESKRISFKGLGHSAPIYPYPEQSEEEKTQNRRVEIKIISK